MPCPLPSLPPAQGEQLQAEVVAKMRQRQEAAKRKREAAEKARYRWGIDGRERGRQGSGRELTGECCWLAGFVGVWQSRFRLTGECRWLAGFVGVWQSRFRCASHCRWAGSGVQLGCTHVFACKPKARHPVRSQAAGAG